MIGRYDELFTTSNPRELAEESIKVIRLAWHDAIIEDPLTGHSLEQALLGLVSLPEQIFVYRDPISKAAWEEHGAITENRHSMIHLAIDDCTLAVIVDDPKDPQTASFLSSISQIASDIRQLRLEAA